MMGCWWKQQQQQQHKESKEKRIDSSRSSSSGKNKGILLYLHFDGRPINKKLARHND